MPCRALWLPAGEYPEAFVQEFRTFTAELRDFFNAGSLAGESALTADTHLPVVTIHPPAAAA